MLIATRVPRGDSGISLLELVVSMALTTLVGAMALTFFVGSFRSGNTTNTATINAAGARVALDAWTSMLRVADSSTQPGSSSNRFVSIAPNDIVFNADLNNRATCSSGCATATTQQVELKVAADTDPSFPGCYVLQQIVGTGSAATTRFLARGITEAAVFSFRTAQGASTMTPASVALVNMTVVSGCPSTATHTYFTSVAVTGQTT